MHSFDVFDTLITRKTATPEGIFALIQQELNTDEKYLKIPNYIKKNFYKLRINSEILARHTYCTIGGDEDVTIEQIYEAMSMTGDINDIEVEELISLEKKVEYENIIPIEKNINKIKDLIDKKENVLLISDMYLDEEIIRKLLVKVDEIFTDIKLYVSSEYKKSKWSGNLYKVVKEHEGVEYKDWIHYGDNLISDIQSANKLGITTELFRFECFKEYEERILSINKDNHFVQLTVGASRNIRLKEGLTGAEAIGASIGSSILYPYVWWIINNSNKKGIRRLYFIARDGYVLKKIADIIIKKYNYDIKTYYIYGSRLAWRIPSISENNYDLFKLMRWSYADKIKDVKGLASFLEIPLEEFMAFLPECYKKGDAKLVESIIAELMKKLNNNIDFKKYFIDYQKEKRKTVIQYLKQEIDTSDENFAFVELAGGGYTQGCLANLMSEFYNNKIKSFFFKLDQMNVMDNCIYYNFIPSHLYLNLIIEMVCRAPHGQTIGYKQDNDKINPVLKDDEGVALIKHGFNEYLRGIEKFSKEYSSVITNNNFEADNLEILLNYMQYITKSPDNEVLEFFAAMPNSVSGREKKVIEFAPKLSEKELRKIFLFSSKHHLESYYEGSSLEYSLLRTTKKEKKKIEMYKKYSNRFYGKILRNLNDILTSRNEFWIANKFPCEIIGQKVIIYGAGKFGKALYRKIKYTTNKEIVKWVDKDYKKYKYKLHRVSSINKINNTEYDSIVIAVLDERIAMSIKKQLIYSGVKEEKIVWVNLVKIWY